MPQIKAKPFKFGNSYAIIIPKGLVVAKVLEFGKDYIWKWEEIPETEISANLARKRTMRANDSQPVALWAKTDKKQLIIISGVVQ